MSQCREVYWTEPSNWGRRRRIHISQSHDEDTHNHVVSTNKSRNSNKIHRYATPLSLRALTKRCFTWYTRCSVGMMTRSRRMHDWDAVYTANSSRRTALTARDGDSARGCCGSRETRLSALTMTTDDACITSLNKHFVNAFISPTLHG